MQLKTNIDESDLGRIAGGQSVQFTVDAYPNTTFTGTVKQVRLNPVVESNVVTYAAMIAAANPRLQLKPGMTANVTIEVTRREGVLRVPSAALRYSPSAAVLAALDSAGASPVKGSKVWVYADGRVKPLAVTPGTSDGRYTEVTGDALTEGIQVVTRVATNGDSATAPRGQAPHEPSHAGGQEVTNKSKVKSQSQKSKRSDFSLLTSDFVQLLPTAGLPCEPRRQRRLAGRRRLVVSRRGRDLPLQLLVVRQAGQVVDEEQRLL